jgi:hypothetical protein
MSYLSQWRLTYDADFVARSRAAMTNQAAIYKDDERGDIAALADDLLTAATPQVSLTFVSVLAAAPGFADEADNGDGTVDSSRITDAELLAALQAQWPAVAALFFAADGTPA